GGSREIAEFRGNSAARADWGRSGGAVGGARASAAGGCYAGVHDFRYEHGVGAREYLPGRSGGREDRRCGGRDNRRVSRSVPRENFVHFTRARPTHANAAGANRGG